MPSRHAKIWKAIKTYLELYPSLPMVAYGGEGFTPPDDSLTPYLIVDDLRFDAVRLYSDAQENWQSGNLVINVMVPIPWSDLQSAEYAGAIADYFAQDTKMEYDGASVMVSRQPTVSGAGYRDGDMFRIPVIVPWAGYGG